MSLLNATTSAHYALDLVALGAIIFFSLRAYKRGFIGCLFTFLSTAISLVVALTFAHSIMQSTGGFFGVQEALGNEVLATLACGAALFFLCKLVFVLLRKILTAALDRVPVVGKFNRLLGFLVGFLPLSFFCGIGARRKTRLGALLSAWIGLTLCHLGGVLWFAHVSAVSPAQAFLLSSLPYIIKDILFIALARAAAKRVKIDKIFRKETP
jgi:hypothetical protein